MVFRRDVTGSFQGLRGPGNIVNTVIVLWLTFLPVTGQANQSSLANKSLWPTSVSGSFDNNCITCHTMDNEPSQFAASVGARGASGASVEITRTNGAAIGNPLHWRYRMESGVWDDITDLRTRTETESGSFEYCVVEDIDGVGQNGARDWACGTFEIANAAPQINTVSSIDVVAGESASLVVTTTDDVAVVSLTAMSQDPLVATVSNNGSPFTVNALSGQQGNTTAINLTAIDSDGEETTATVQVTIEAPANNAPTLDISPSANQTLTTGESLSVQATGSDSDNDTLSYSADSSDESVATVTGGGSNGSFTINTLQAGFSVISFEVSDGRGGSDTETLDLTVNQAPNQPPSLALSIGSNVTVGVGNTLDLVASGSDPDGDSLTYSGTSNNESTATVISDGTANGFTIVGVQAGSATVTVTVDDGRGGSAAESVTVTVEQEVVNQPPVVSLDTGDFTLESATSRSVQATASDPDGDTLNYSASSADSSVATVSGGGSTGAFTVTSVSAGVVTISFQVTDGRGGSDTASVSVTVTAPAVNRNPTLSLTPSAQQVVTVGATLQVQVAVSDPDGDSLTTSASSANSAVVSVSGGGSTYTLSANEVGTASVEFSVSDGRGGTASQSINVVVEPAPVANRAPVLSLNSDASQTIAVGASLPISASATDADGDSLTFSAQSFNQSIATVSGGGSTGDFTVQAQAAGATTIRIAVDDGNGGSDSADLQLNVEAPAPEDQDLDDVPDDIDNCPIDSNPRDSTGRQIDTDGDGAGDVCDIDADGDGVLDGVLQALVTQNNRSGNIAFAADGQIDIVAGLTRGRIEDGTAVYDWSTSDASLLAVSQANLSSHCDGLAVQGDVCGRLQIDASSLPVGIHRARLTLDVNGLSAQSAIDVVVLSGSSGSFNDFSDSDGDGIPAFVDNDPVAADAIPLSTDNTDRRIRVESGSRLSIGRFAALHSSDAGFNPTTSIVRFDQFQEAATGIVAGVTDSDANAPQASNGVYNFNIYTDVNAGQTLSAVMQLIDAVPADAPLSIFQSNNTWQSFSAGSDRVYAAVPIDGNCPVTSMQERWALAWGNGGDPTVAGGRSCLFLQWQDGGPNDADGQVNGVVSVVFSVGEELACDDCNNNGPVDVDLDPSDDGGGSAGLMTVVVLLALLFFGFAAGVATPRLTRITGSGKPHA